VGAGRGDRAGPLKPQPGSGLYNPDKQNATFFAVRRIPARVGSRHRGWDKPGGAALNEEDKNGHTSQGTGESCATDGGWWHLHSRLAHYQTVSGDSCTPTGTTGSWNAATGGSGGWQEWEIDLSAYAGKQVEIAIVAATDWAVGGLGAYVDDASTQVGAGAPVSTSFETDLGRWAAGPSPEGTPNPEPQWTRSTQQFQEGAVVGTDDSVYAGFEPGSIETTDERTSFVREVLQHLGVLGG